MVFSSAVFLFVFLPALLGVYYLTPVRFRSYTLLAGSLIFYGWWRVDFLFLMLAVVLWNHLIAKAMVRNANTPKAKKFLILGIVLNLGTLGIFKYFNFGVDSINAILEHAGMQPIETIRIILPIGISFYIFQAVSFLIDVYRGDAPPAKRLVDFAAFITLFPQLIAGPILRYKDLEGQFRQRTHSFDKFSEGSQRFMLGFAKKVLIADTVAPLADAAFALHDPSMADAWLGAIAYTIQLYFDFSGYSDMAIGLGLMMGFRFCENFNNPYVSRSITEFWRRWHISLSTWLRDYLYIPLGGNRKGKLKTYRNLILTMLLGGLWHGANWTFVIWGAWHGTIMAIERALGVKGVLESKEPLPKRFLANMLCLLFVILGWVMFRAENVGVAINMYKGMMGMGGIGISDAYGWQIKGMAVVGVLLGCAVVFVQPRIVAALNSGGEGTKPPHRSLLIGLGVCALFVLAVMRLMAQNYSPFLYFQF